VNGEGWVRPDDHASSRNILRSIAPFYEARLGPGAEAPLYLPHEMKCRPSVPSAAFAATGGLPRAGQNGRARRVMCSSLHRARPGESRRSGRSWRDRAIGPKTVFLTLNKERRDCERRGTHLRNRSWWTLRVGAAPAVLKRCRGPRLE